MPSLAPRHLARRLALIAALATGAFSAGALAQRAATPAPTTPASQSAPTTPTRATGAIAAPGEADPGVRPTRLIDRDEIRVSRVDLQPGAARSVHQHDDVEYHVWTPVQGELEFTMGNDRPVAARAGQAFFMKKGTPHGFRNTGTTPAAVFEIFVKTAGSARP